MPNLPDFRKGQRWSDLQARELQQLVNEVKKIGNIRAGPGISVLNTADGLAISLSPGKRGPANVAAVACVLVEEPEEDATKLKVRRIRYKELPPVIGEYEWDGDEFEAFPDIGYDIESFEGWAWTDEDGEPVLEMPLLRARFVEQQWLIWIPFGQAVRFVVAREKEPDSQATTIMVSPVFQEDDHFILKGEASTRIFTWPNLVRGDYAPLAQPTGDAVVPSTNVLAAVRYRGGYYLEQTQRWAFAMQDARFDITECLPVLM